MNSVRAGYSHPEAQRDEPTGQTRQHRPDSPEATVQRAFDKARTMAGASKQTQNDRIEAAVIVAALASLGLLVALAVTTSVNAVSHPVREAGVSPMPQGTDTASSLTGIAPASSPEAPRPLR